MKHADYKGGMISVIMPVYNTVGYLSESIESCLKQTYGNIELIAVNDGSTDNSLQILQEYARKDSRVKVFTGLNQGVVMARKRAIENANGEYLYFLDSDDTLQSEIFSPLIKKMKETNADMVLSDLLVQNKSDINILRHSIRKNDEISYLQELLLYRFPGSLYPVLFKRQLFENIDIPIELKIGEDFLTLVQIMMKYSPKYALIDTAAHCYVQQRTGSAMNTCSPEMARQQILLSDYVERQLRINSGLYEKLQCEIAYFHMHNLFVYLSKVGKNPDRAVIRRFIDNYAEKARPYMGKGMRVKAKAIEKNNFLYRITESLLNII
ncbi:MAG: glycosyltransferase family 2 protein [Bacteroidales bacterium]|nr:glycosyltransferase family 2 protein [Bacteroidales bacterium]